MEGLWKFLFDPKVRDAVTSILEILAAALKDGIEEGEALQVLHYIANVLIDLMLPESNLTAEITLK